MAPLRNQSAFKCSNDSLKKPKAILKMHCLAAFSGVNFKNARTSVCVKFFWGGFEWFIQGAAGALRTK